MVKVAVVGHVEHTTIASIPALPATGDIVLLKDARTFVGGGGGVAFYQVVRGPAEVVLYTAIGNDDAGRFVAERLARTGARVHAAIRARPHTRSIVLVTAEGERTVLVMGQSMQPQSSDSLPWEELATCDAAYFTADDPDALRAARAARVLVVSARRREALARSGVCADVIVGSIRDPNEVGRLADYSVPPVALVLTNGSRGGQVETVDGVTEFAPTAAPSAIVGTYGAGDSFAGALTFYLAAGLDAHAAATNAAKHGAAVLAGLVPNEHHRSLSYPSAPKP